MPHCMRNSLDSKHVHPALTVASLSRTYLAHHELESNLIIITIIIIIIIIIITTI